MVVYPIGRVYRFSKLILFTIILNIQPWCSTKVDDNGLHVSGNWADCGPDCPVEVIPWYPDDTLKVTHHSLDQKETMIAVKLFSIMASSLLLIGLMVTGLGILYAI